MRGLTDIGPTADQTGITTVVAINDISITVADRPGPCVIIGTIGYIDTDVAATLHTARLLQEGVVIPGAIVQQATGAVDNIAGGITVMAFVENVPIGATFTMDISTIGTGLDVIAGNAQLLVLSMGQQGAEVANFVSP